MKTLLETYRQLQELTNPAMVKAAQAAAKTRMDSSQARMGGNPTGAPSSVAQPKMTSSQARMGGNPTGAPVTAVTRTPAPMGGSKPAIDNRNRMAAAKSPNMQGGPARPQAGPVSRTPSVNAAIGSANPTDDQRRAGMSITNVRDAMYGKNPTAKAKAGPTPNTGASAASPVPNVERPRLPAVKQNAGMKGSPLDQTQGARPEVSRDYRLNKMRQNPPALDPKRNADLDTPSEKSAMARATNQNIGGAGGVGSAFGKQSGSGTTIKPKAQAAPVGQAQAATAAKNADMKGGSGVPAAKANDASWSQKVGKAMRDHIAKGGKAGDTIKVDGKDIKVAWKDKAYQKRLVNKAKKLKEEKLDEARKYGGVKAALAHPALRNRAGQQSMSKGRRYRIRTKPLISETIKKVIKARKGANAIKFDPENSNPIQ